MNDNYVVFDGEKNISIYPLMELDKDGKHYLIYSKTNAELNFDDIYVGEVLNDTLNPVDDSLLSEFDEILKKVCSNYN